MNFKTRRLQSILQTPVTDLTRLPALVPRQLAASVSFFSERTLQRHEKPDALIPIKGRHQRVFYGRENLLQWLGVEVPEPAPAPPPEIPAQPKGRRRRGRPPGSRRRKVGKATDPIAR